MTVSVPADCVVVVADHGTGVPREDRERIFERFWRGRSAKTPGAFGWALCALDLHFAPRRELAIIGRPEDELARAALGEWLPNAVVAFGPGEDVPLLEGKTAVDGKPTLYLCERLACSAPVTDLAALAVRSS